MESLETRRLMTVINAADGAALTSALSSAQLGDTIVLQAGTTYTPVLGAAFTLANKSTGSGSITITSSNLASLPAGVRVKPSDAANMPKIVSAGNNVSAIKTAAGAHDFKLIGLEITTTNNNTLTSLLNLGDETTAQSSMSVG